MKTPTLIVRLVGFYLIVKCSLILMQVREAETAVPSFGIELAGPMLSSLHFQSAMGLLAGLLIARFSGLLARWLTFDARSRQRYERAPGNPVSLRPIPPSSAES